tara:strand:+ start:867 stop:1604 length:738 start_codon:yes stop_codon:yes gene_type:complete
LAHSVISPSAFDKLWSKCPASASLSAKAPYVATEATVTGSAAHWMAEKIMRQELIDIDPYKHFVGQTYADGEVKITIDKKLVQKSLAYANYVLKKKEEMKAEMLIEEKVYVSEVSDYLFGTADIILIGKDKISLIDFKSGKWPVEAINNGQLKIYTLGAVMRWGDKYKYENVIFQNGKAKETTLDLHDLVDWGLGYLKEKVELALEKNPTEVVGQQCLLCKGKHLCKKYTEFKSNGGNIIWKRNQ